MALRARAAGNTWEMRVAAFPELLSSLARPAVATMGKGPEARPA